MAENQTSSADDWSATPLTLVQIFFSRYPSPYLPADAPGLEARLSSVSVQYRIAGGASTANVKVWGICLSGPSPAAPDPLETACSDGAGPRAFV